MVKRAQIFDPMTISIMVFSFVIGLFILYIVSGAISANLTATGMDTYGVYARAYAALAGWDYVAVAIYFGLIIFSIGSAWFARSNPFFFIVSIISSIVNIFVAVIVSNIFYDMISTEAEFGATAAVFSHTTTIMTNLPLLTFASCMAIAILLNLPSGRKEYVG